MTPKFMEHIHIDVPKDLTPKFDEFGDMVVSATNQMIVQQVESIDDAICKQIHDMAVANGIDDVYVLDKKQILSALEKQIPKRIREYNRCRCCDTYNEIIEKRKNTVKYDICYCWHCGQALSWEGDSE
jgi:translation initiation factor 2 beta subunit (eIF-2beta)/eIF-5